MMEMKLKTVLITLLLTMISCSSPKEVVQGYEGALLAKAQKAVQGKSPAQVLKLLGTPAVQGLCRKCGPRGLYRMVYLTKDMSRFYLELSYNTDQSIDCVVLDFNPDLKLKRYVFDSKKGIHKNANCNRKGGAILELQQIMELEEKEATATKR